MTILFRIVMPQVKPAILTLIIFAFQGLWTTGSGLVVYNERLKTMTDAIASIASAGTATVARAGVIGAASLLMISVPIIVFIISQAQVVETMATSGIK